MGLDRTLNRNKSNVEYNEFGDQLCDCCGRNIVEHEDVELCDECFNEIQETAKIIGYRKGE